MRKKNILLWLLLFILLTTYYFDFNKTSFVEIFKVKKIELYGTENVEESLINLKLKQFEDQNIFLIDQDEIASLLVGIDFINTVEIKKIYPSKIKIRINEDKIVAIIIDSKNKYLLTKGGEVIKKYDDKFSFLPTVYGKDAKVNFPIFYKFLIDLNFNIDEVEYFKYFETERWDIFLKNDRLIKLPMDKERAKNSIKKFVSIENKENFKKFKIFDFRIENQLIIN